MMTFTNDSVKHSGEDRLPAPTVHTSLVPFSPYGVVT
jgi:hypothetical protein